MIQYNDDDVIITDVNEIMTYAESKKYCAPVYRTATNKEAEYYRVENEYWRKQAEQEQMNGSYHELPD